MVHSFWYEEAAKAFTAAGQADPHCAMAWWGVAMTYWHPLWAAPDADDLRQGQAAVDRARAIGAKTDRERAYIDAISAFYQNHDKVDHRTRALAYEKAMKQMTARYPEDREAAVFYALSLLATALPSDKTYANQREAGAILEKIYAEQPNHPGVAHYIIHSYDNPVLAPRALTAARSYAKIAPGVPHALHMPSHIFVRLGLWQEAISSNLASQAAGKAYEQKTHMTATWDQTLHAEDYLTYAYLQSGQEAQARQVMEEANAIVKVQPPSLAAWYALAAIPARYTVERHRWADAAALTVRPQMHPAAEAITWWARALGAALTGDLAGAESDVAKLESLRQTLLTSSDPKGKYWAGLVEIQIQQANAGLAHARGNGEEALRLLRSAAQMEDATEKDPITPGPVIPAHELLADLLFGTGQPAQALAEYEASLKTSPNRLNAVYGAARAAEAASKPEVARKYYDQVLSACATPQSDGPEMRRAKDFLAKK